MDAALITNITNWVLLGLFFLVIIILALCFLRGYFRGWKYGTYRIIAFAVAFVVAFATLKLVGNAIGNLNLPFLGTVSFQITSSGETYNIAATFGSLNSVISSIVEQVLKAYHVNMAPEAIAAYALAVANSAVLLITMIIEGILIATIYNLLVMILWHAAFIRIIPKEKREASKKKLRFVSAAEELLIGALCMVMIMAPLTSMVNSLANGWDNNENTSNATKSIQADDETYQTIQGIVDTYNNSAFAKAFFSWTKFGGDFSFDQALTNWATAGSYDNATVSLVNELTYLTKVGSIVVENGFLSQDGDMATKAIFFAVSEGAPELLRALAKSSLITGIMPFALEIVTNLDGVKEYLKTNEGIDFSGNYSLTLDKLASIYSNLINNSDLTSAVVNEDGSIGEPSDIINAAFTSNTQTPMEVFFDELNSSEDLAVINTVLSSAFYVMACNAKKAEAEDPEKYKNQFTIADFVPDVGEYDSDGDGIPDKVSDEFLNFGWFKQIAIAYDAIVQLVGVDSRFLSLLTSGIGQETYTIDSDTMIDLYVDRIRDVAPIVYGDLSDTAGKNPDVSINSYCLLDCDMIKFAVPKIFNVLADSVNNAFNFTGEKAISLEKVGEELTDPTALKNEFKNLFEVIYCITDTEEGKDFLKNLDQLRGIYTHKEEADSNPVFLGANKNLVNSLANALDKLDSSKVAKALMPPIFTNYLTGDDSPLKQAGLDLQFDFENVDIGTNLASLIRVYNSCQGVVSYVTGLGSAGDLSIKAANSMLYTMVNYKADDGNGNLVPQIQLLLKEIVTNPLLNPSGSNNGNIASLLKMVLKSALNNEEYSTLIDETVAATDLTSGGSTEITAIVNAFIAISESDLLSAMNGLSGGSFNLSSLANVSFETILGAVGQSKIISKIMAKFLNDTLLHMNINGVEIDIESEGVDFTAVTDWAEEGKAIDKLVKAATSIGDLNNIDFINSSPDAIRDILLCLSQSEIFPATKEGTTGCAFSSVLASALIASVKDNSEMAPYFADIDSTAGNYTFETLRNDITSLTREDWLSESDTFSSVIRYLQLFGLDMTFADLRDMNADLFENLINNISLSKSVGRLLSYRVFKIVNDAIVGSNTSSPFAKANLDYIWNLDDISERQKEDATLSSLVHTVIDPSGYDGSKYTYVFLNEAGAFNGANLDIKSIPAQTVIKPMLNALAESKVYNTRKTGETMTSFELEVADLLVKSGLYGENNEATKDKVLAAVSKIGDTDTATHIANWKNEIVSLVNIIEAVQNSPINLFDFKVEDYFSKSLSADQNEANRVELNNILNLVNEDELLYEIIPTQIENAINSIDAGNFDLSKANVHYAERYDSEEISHLTYIIKDSFLRPDTTNASALTDPYLQDLLRHASQSKVVNSLKSGETKTCLENEIVNILAKSG
ncbi:MAG: hypothetical protein K5694_02675, partial [Bacilli bacterium]|nr:hypothetical protein [Bacilli bacterium]